MTSVLKKLPMALAAIILSLAFADYASAEVGSDFEGRRPASDYNFELRVGYSQLPVVQAIVFGLSSWPTADEELGKSRLSGTFSLEMDWNILTWLSVGVAGNMSRFTQPVLNEITEEQKVQKEIGKHIGTALTLMPDVRFSWFNRSIVRLYSEMSFGVGVAFFNDTVRSNLTHTFYPAYQFTPLGVSVGGRVYGFFECGAGTEYIGGMLGVGVRF